MKRLYYKVKSHDIGQYLIAIVFGIAAINISLLVHEKFGHVFAALLMGYDASMVSDTLFEGATAVQGVNIPLEHLAVIALAGPLVSFIFGQICWSFGKNHPLRYVGLVSWLISTLPNLMPVGSRDAAIAAQYFGKPLMWLLFYVMFSYVWVRLLFEGIGPVEVIEK